jgi:hypothetical protein
MIQQPENKKLNNFLFFPSNYLALTFLSSLASKREGILSLNNHKIMTERNLGFMLNILHINILTCACRILKISLCQNKITTFTLTTD